MSKNQKNIQKYRKIIKNIEKPGKKRQKYRKDIKNIEKLRMNEKNISK